MTILIKKEVEFAMSEIPKTVEDLLDQNAYQKAQAQNDGYRWCLIEVLKRTQDNKLKEFISAVLQGNKTAMQEASDILEGKRSKESFANQNQLPEESRIYNAYIDYEEDFIRVWETLTNVKQDQVRENIHRVMTEEILTVVQAQHTFVKYTRISLYPKGTIQSRIEESMFFYWLPIATIKGRRVITILGLAKNL